MSNENINASNREQLAAQEAAKNTNDINAKQAGLFVAATKALADGAREFATIPQGLADAIDNARSDPNVWNSFTTEEKAQLLVDREDYLKQAATFKEQSAELDKQLAQSTAELSQMTFNGEKLDTNIALTEQSLRENFGLPADFTIAKASTIDDPAGDANDLIPPPLGPVSVQDPYGVLAAEDEALRQEEIAQSDADAFASAATVRDPTGVLAAEDAALTEQAAAQGDADAFAGLATVRDPAGVLAAEDAALAEQAAAQGDADAFASAATVRDLTGVLAAEDAALAEQAAAQGDADAFAGLATVQDPNGVLAAEDAAIAEQQAAQGDADAFASAATIRDPAGVLAAEDAALAEQAAAQGDADAFGALATVRDPTGVLAAEDAALAEQAAAQGDADAFGALATVRDPTGVLAAEDAALAEQAAAQGDADAFAGLATVRDPTGVLAAEDAALAEQAAAQGDADAFATSALANNEKSATLTKAQEQRTLQQRYKQPGNQDWRVRLVLAEGANYLYKDTANQLLKPLMNANGVIFPYTPSIAVNYTANYDNTDLTHSNYRGYFYKSSVVGEVTITATFTAQDTAEAQYLLAVIHFFKSVTKMFYGQDAQRGAPPPLLYLVGLGEFQFNGHPCVVKNFQYTLPTDVDYIRASSPNNYGINLLNRRTATTTPSNPISSVLNRLQNAGLFPGANPKTTTPNPGPTTGTVNNTQRPTYVPTKMDMTIQLLPLQTRSQVSQQFSVKEFANGNLLKGGFW